MENFSIKTPLYHHLSTDDFNHIYSPSEDTFLLIDAFEKDIEQILKLKPSLCLEIGIGSGIVITALGTVLGKCCKYIGTDINPVACEKAKQTGIINGVDIDTFCCDLASDIPHHLKGSIDILIFNPPYVVTESDEIAAGPLELTWAGGKKGREVIDRLFPELSSLLSAKGVFFLILEKNNDPEEVVKMLRHLGFLHECVAKRKSLSEFLFVMKFRRQK